MNNRESTSKAQGDWEKHFCGGADPRIGNLRRQELKEVRHVAHVADACSILLDGQINASVFEGDGKLASYPKPVTWLSANTWARGSIYGNVEFVFDWQEIIDGRRLYWIDTVYRRSITYQILLTSNRARRGVGVPYKPVIHRGPVVCEDQHWLWNGDSRVAEFILDSELSLAQCKRIDFVDHCQDYCKNQGVNCHDLTLYKSSARMQLMAFVLANECHNADEVLRRKHLSFSPIDHFVREFVSAFTPYYNVETHHRTLRPNSQHARKLMRTILLHWVDCTDDNAYKLAGRFSERSFRKTLNSVVDDHFN